MDGGAASAAPRIRKEPSIRAAEEAPDESIFKYPVRKVARNLRYLILERLVDKEVTICSWESAKKDLLPLVAEYLDPAYSQELLTPLDGGLYAKYGFLDLEFRAQPRWLTQEPKRGISLLKYLGYISEEKPMRFTDPEQFEDMAQLIEAGETFLKLFLVDESFKRWDGKERWNPYLNSRQDFTPEFPLRFKITDACLTNCSMVWIWRHLYLQHSRITAPRRPRARSNREAAWASMGLAGRSLSAHFQKRQKWLIIALEIVDLRVGQKRSEGGYKDRANLEGAAGAHGCAMEHFGFGWQRELKTGYTGWKKHKPPRHGADGARPMMSQTGLSQARRCRAVGGDVMREGKREWTGWGGANRGHAHRGEMLQFEIL